MKMLDVSKKKNVIETVLLILLASCLVYLWTPYFTASVKRPICEKQPSLKTAQGCHIYAKYLYDQGRYAEAEAVAKKALSINPAFAKAYIDLGIIYTYLGFYEAAEKSYRLALRYIGTDSSNKEVTYFNLGVLYGKMRDAEKAWRCLKKAYVLKDYLGAGFWDIDYACGPYYVSRDDKGGFFEFIKGQGLPVEISDRLKAISKDLKSCNYTKVINECKRFIKTNPHSPYSYRFIEMLSIGSAINNRDDELKRVLEGKEYPWLTEGQLADIKYSIAYYFYMKKRYSDMLVYLYSIIKNSKNYAGMDNVLYLTAKGYSLEDKRPEAKAVLEDFITRFPQSKNIGQARLELGAIYEKMGDYNRSFHEYVKSGLLVNAIIICFLWLFLFSTAVIGAVFFISRLFFKRKYIPPSEKNIYLVSDLYLSLILFFGITTTVQLYIIYPLNYYFEAVFKYLHINPMLISFFLGQVVLLIYCLFIMKKKYKLDNRYLGFVSHGFGYNVLLPMAVAALSIFVSFVFFAILYAFNIKVPMQPIKELAYNIVEKGDIWGLCSLFFISVIIAPISEEVVYRVFLYNFFKRYSNRGLAILGSAILFAIAHYNVVTMPYYIIMGVILAFIYIETESVIPCMVTHAFYNLVITALTVIRL